MSQCGMAVSMPMGVLDYATPSVRTSPPRRVWRMTLAAAWWCVRRTITLVRLSILGVGYTVLGLGIGLRFTLGIVAMILLFVGGLRWAIVKTRTLRAATWVDRKTLQAVEFVRRRLPARLPPA